MTGFEITSQNSSKKFKKLIKKMFSNFIQNFARIPNLLLKK